MRCPDFLDSHFHHPIALSISSIVESPVSIIIGKFNLAQNDIRGLWTILELAIFKADTPFDLAISLPQYHTQRK